MLLILIVLELIIFQKKIKIEYFRIQPYDSIMFEYFCIGFTAFMLKGKILTDFKNLFSLNN